MSICIPADMIYYQWKVEKNSEPFPGPEKKKVEENMDEVLRQYQLENKVKNTKIRYISKLSGDALSQALISTPAQLCQDVLAIKIK